jgi:predicted SnoaL-like aldol condensation-catalyzing enzyme
MTMASVQERNKKIAQDLLDAAFNKKDPKLAAQFVTERYIQHNPQVPTGKAGLMAALPGFYKAIPSLKWSLKHIWAEGDYVIVHSVYDFGKDTAVVDIFRFEGGKADEHWDVVQEIPEKMAHDNGMI